MKYLSAASAVLALGLAAQGQAQEAEVQLDEQLAVDACIAPEDQQRDMSEFSREQRDAILACSFKEAERQLAPQLPLQLDDVTQIVAVSADGLVFSYRYAIDIETADVGAEAASFLSEATRENVCNDPDMLATMQEGGSFAYAWYDNSDKLIHRMTVSTC
ncbi:hypothetical protein [Qipengyuania sp. JC766]|uniref:hypothetical protein n=1 Tax=Qipengyuania sp. JC766 TaxID=3232139 RepID=UPI00345AA579